MSIMSYGQHVETITSHSTIVDGLYCNHEGKVYTTSGGLVGGVTIGEYDPSTDTYNPGFASGFSGPINIAEFNDSTWLVTNYDDNTLRSYNVNTGMVQTVATGLDGPAGIAIGPHGNAYISSFGAPPTYSGHRVFKYTPTGSISVFIDSTVLFRPQGITFDHEGNLYVASSTDPSNNGKIYKAAAGDSSLSLIAVLGVGIGNMAYRSKDSLIYFPSRHRIMKMSTDGDYSLYAGATAPSHVDGSLTSARFQYPLGIAFSPTMDTMYIAEANTYTRLRRIVMEPTVGNIEKTNLDQEPKIFPNPATDEVYVEVPTHLKGSVLSMDVYNIAGKKVNHEPSISEDGIQLKGLSPGVYLLKIRFDSQSWTGKFIIR